jgi:hypothetical protein
MSIQEKLLEEFEDMVNTTDVLTESSDLTYYELRKFVTVLLKNVRGKDTKKILSDLLNTVSRMEIIKVPIPTIKKQKSISPKIFGDS